MVVDLPPRVLAPGQVTEGARQLELKVVEEVAEPIDRTQLALEATAAASAAGPPPVSLATLMGPDFDAMFANIGAALRGGLLAPVQIIATR